MSLIFTAEEARACWSHVAHALSAEVTVSEELAWPSSQYDVRSKDRLDVLRLRAHIDDIPVHLEMRDRDSFTTRISALAEDDGLHLRVYSGYVYPLGRALGIQDIAVGDPIFDDRFIVKANDASFARAWLDADLRGHLLAAPDYTYILGDGEVVARARHGLETDASALQHAARAVAGLVAGRRRLLAELAARVGGRLGAHTVEVDVEGITCDLDTTLARLGHASRLATRIRAARTGARVDVDLDALPRRVQDLLSRAQPDQVLVDPAAVTVLFAGWLDDPERLRAALAVVAALAPPDLPSDGPYR